MTAEPQKPFNDLPDLPPPGDIETKAILKDCISAHRALAQLKLAGDLIPDQSVLINTIPLLEAKASSEIENIVTTNDALFREASHPADESDAATKEALRYRAALFDGVESLKLRPLTTRVAIELCSRIKGADMDVRTTPGTALQNSATGEIIYTPPTGEKLLRDKLSNWEAFINDEESLDPLVQMAIQHYQFEAIHPFTDGNGRTGRVLNILMLLQAELLDIPTLYLSRHILNTKEDYYRHLSAVTYQGDWETWISYMIGAVEQTATWTNNRIRTIRKLMDHTSEYIRENEPKIHSHELIETVFAKPYLRITDLIDRNIAKRNTATRYLRKLVELGILEEEKKGRTKIFIHRKYMELLGDHEHTYTPYN